MKVIVVERVDYNYNSAVLVAPNIQTAIEKIILKFNWLEKTSFRYKSKNNIVFATGMHEDRYRTEFMFRLKEFDL